MAPLRFSFSFRLRFGCTKWLIVGIWYAICDMCSRLVFTHNHTCRSHLTCHVAMLIWMRMGLAASYSLVWAFKSEVYQHGGITGFMGWRVTVRSMPRSHGRARLTWLQRSTDRLRMDVVQVIIFVGEHVCHSNVLYLRWVLQLPADQPRACNHEGNICILASRFLCFMYTV